MHHQEGQGEGTQLGVRQVLGTRLGTAGREGQQQALLQVQQLREGVELVGLLLLRQLQQEQGEQRVRLQQQQVAQAWGLAVAEQQPVWLLKHQL
jgi:hypothetical protein